MARSVNVNARHPDGSCGYCGSFGGGMRVDQSTGKRYHDATTCLHCGLRTCMAVSSKCPRCFAGLLAGWSGHTGPCERARCDQPRVAYIRKRYVCSKHAGPPLIPDYTRLHWVMRLTDVPDNLDGEGV